MQQFTRKELIEHKKECGVIPIRVESKKQKDNDIIYAKQIIIQEGAVPKPLVSKRLFLSKLYDWIVFLLIPEHNWVSIALHIMFVWIPLLSSAPFAYYQWLWNFVRSEI